MYNEVTKDKLNIDENYKEQRKLKTKMDSKA